MFTYSFSFFESSERTSLLLPSFLEPRTASYTALLLAIFSLSFLLISFARKSNSRSLTTVIQVFFREASTAEVQLKENMRIDSFSSVLLIVNYFVSFSLCNFIFFQRILLIDDFSSMLLAVSIPFMLIIVETISVLVVGLLTGVWNQISFTLLHTFNIAQFSGLLFSVIALFWTMNQNADKLFLSLYLMVISLKVLSRLLKNSIAVLAKGFNWYYLLLYLCTLEILPIFMLTHVVLKNFTK